jgi:hypothetical protein
MDTSGKKVLQSYILGYNKEKNTIGNIYEPEVVLEDKVYLEMYYKHQLGCVEVDETLAKIKTQEL